MIGGGIRAVVVGEDTSRGEGEEREELDQWNMFELKAGGRRIKGRSGVASWKPDRCQLEKGEGYWAVKRRTRAMWSMLRGEQQARLMEKMGRS